MTKTFKVFMLFALTFIVGSMASCTDYQDEIDALKERLDAQKDRVDTLYSILDRTNDNVEALHVIVNAMAEGWVITGIVEVDAEHDPDGVGYTAISFGKIDPETGELSAKPEDKKVVILHNGKDGIDANAPNITLKQDPDDGNYYWALGDEWLTTPDGERIRSNGKDGEDGHSTAPVLDINDNGEWIISYDGGKTWHVMRDSDGNPIKATGKDGRDGNDGEDGDDAREYVTRVVVITDIDGTRYVEFTLYNGVVIRLPLV